MGELGSPFSAVRVDFLVLFTRAVVFFILLTIRLPLLLTFTSAPSSSSICSCAPLGIEYMSVMV